jgi:hypothetical protein
LSLALVGSRQDLRGRLAPRHATSAPNAPVETFRPRGVGWLLTTTSASVQRTNEPQQTTRTSACVKLRGESILTASLRFHAGIGAT